MSIFVVQQWNNCRTGAEDKLGLGKVKINASLIIVRFSINAWI